MAFQLSVDSGNYIAEFRSGISLWGLAMLGRSLEILDLP
jgi:hypothetical protein